MEWEGKGEGGTFSDSRLYGNLSSEFLDDDLTERESQSVAIVGGFCIARHISLEDVLEIARGNTRACISDKELDIGTVVYQTVAVGDAAIGRMLE